MMDVFLFLLGMSLFIPPILAMAGFYRTGIAMLCCITAVSVGSLVFVGW